MRALFLIAASALSISASSRFDHIPTATVRSPAQKLSHSSSLPPLAGDGASFAAVGLLAAAGAVLALGAARLAWAWGLPPAVLLAPMRVPLLAPLWSALLRGAV